MADTEHPCTEPPPKRPRLKCIIHCSDDTDNLITPKSVDSWNTLLRAAQIRQHDPILELAKDTPEGEIPALNYHRKCRSIFTMKKALAGIIAQKKKTTSGGHARVGRASPSTSTTYEANCIFCQKKNKYAKRQKTREVLVKCRELRADAKIRNAATKKLDSRILGIVSRDIVAAEAHYHRSCYRLYTRSETSQQEGALSANDQEDEDIYEAAVSQSYSELFHYIREELFGTPKVLMMTDITSKLAASMKNFGVDKVQDSTKKHIRQRIETEFGGSLHIIPDHNGKLLIYPDNLTVQELVRENQSLKKQLKTLSRGDAQELQTKTAKQLRADIKTKAKDINQSWPPEIESVKSDIIPESLLYFLRILLIGSNDPDSIDSVTPRVQRLMQSFGQDIVYAVTCGKVKPPKHIALSFSVKSLTGNVQLISILNRLGHCVAYSQMEEIDTALCMQKLSTSGGGPTLPSNIFPSLFTTLAWDNIDRLEETLSGEGTSHRVNGIAVQEKMTVLVPDQPRPTVARTKKRSIDAPPLMLPTYNAGQRAGPPMTKTTEVVADMETKLARQKNLVWMLSRMLQEKDQSVSSWTGFNIKTREEVAVTPDNIGYLPTINAPATQMSTVNEILKQSLHIQQSLGLTKIVCVFDQALYAKAVEITWKHPEQFSSIIIRMGAFHTICTLIATIGKRFQDAGLRDLCVESGVVAQGSVAGIMEGRKYNRAVRLHKLVYEALLHLVWKGFLPWLETTNIDDMVHLEESLRVIDIFSKDISQNGLEQILKNPSCTCILNHFEEYIEVLRRGSGLAAFWVTYIDVVEILLGLIRASREGDWTLHLSCIQSMIPWCFAYDRVNYARYLSYYLAQMSQLPITHPDVHAEFMAGKFSVQLGSVNPFGRIPVDQTIEETVNKDTQTAGGTKGFSLKPGAVRKYYITQEYRSQYLRQLREMTGGSSSKLTHPDLQTERQKKDERDVEALTDMMENSWLNPMSPEEEDLLSLSTGTVAPPEVSRDLLRAHAVGEAAYQEFKARLDEDQHEEFYGKLKKQGLKTFANVSIKCKSKNSQDIVLKADRNLFSHMILVAESRQVNMKDVLAHPLGPLPWALANTDGTLRKTNKAVLARELEKNVSAAEEIPTPSATIIDGMGLVQKLNGSNKTFGQVAELAFTHILHEGGQSKRIDIVFDVYRSNSIKHAERVNRGADNALHYKKLACGNHVQQWRKFLSGSSNKTSLIKFLTDEWKLSKYREKLKDKVLYVTCEQYCFKVTEDKWEEVPDLESTQEEADSRLFLHTQHAARDGYKAVIISSEDTDVFIISLAMHSTMDVSIYQKFGTKSRTRYADINKIGKSQGQWLCDSLIGLHAFTGCDSVSCFAGKGKLLALKLLKKDPTNQAFKQLGQLWELSNEIFEKLEQFTYAMYAGCRSNKSRSSTVRCSSVNELRYQLFCAKRGEAESSQLPPCRDCLFLHTQRANFQAAVWRRCLESKPNIPSPSEHGWTEEDGKLKILWMRSAPAPEVVLELLACKCSRLCKLPDCRCLVNGLTCTDMCKLQTCTNQAVQQEEPDLEPDSEDSEDD